ncbi:HPr family phosphocarrier protein [Oscillibacter valericigenes]|uniref:HPr family phosphocarrier protein n=1 Tax=Oscillibacter valericigenes TaxID=351091 RepID=UPI001F3BD182|nr:HPr family phosphocarrier protein [Oscillibacter valericigenes]MCF2616492.1 HPr family phosphocarrier protein [Oscillibacter valericigenes]
MTSKEIIVTRDGGLKEQDAALFIRNANEYQSQIRIRLGEKSVNAKSLLGVLSMGVRHGAVLTVTAEGPDEEDAVNALRRYFEA